MSDTASSPPRLPSSQREAVEVLRAVWPARDGRHNAYLHLAGWLFHAGWNLEQVAAFVLALVRVTGDEEEADRLRVVHDTAAKKGGKTSGAPQLLKALGEKAGDALRRVAFLLGRPLTLASLAHAKGFTPEYLASLGVREAGDNYGAHLLIPYKDADGQTVRTRKRVSLYGEPRFFWVKDPTTKGVLAYGQERLGEARRLGYLIVVEGETDVWAGWLHGLPVLGLPGAGAYGKLLAEHLDGVRTVFVVREPGPAGEQFARGIAARLGQVGCRGCLLAIDAPEDCKDLCELHQQSGDRFDAAWATWLQRATPVDITCFPAGCKKPPARPPEPFRPFPVHCLPCVLERFVREAAAALGCDPSYLALPALAVCAALVGNTRTLRIKRSWFAPSVLWTLLVGDSGTMKTPAMKLVLDPVFDLQRRLKLEYEASLEAYEKEHAGWAARKKKAERDAKDKPDARPFEEPEPQKPKRQRLLTSDVTIECLATLLNDNPRGLLVYRDELRGWLSSFTRYAGSGATDMPHWLSMHSAATLLVDRKTGEPAHIHVERAAVSVTGSIQPGVLAKALTDEHKDAGLAARLLMAMPPRKPKCWTEDEIDEHTLESYAYVLGNLAALEFKPGGGPRLPLALSMDEAARRAWVAFYDEWAQEQAAAEGDLASALSKLEEGAARLALLHHVVNLESRGGDDPDEPAKVGEGSVRAGAEMARWFARETARIYAMLRESAEARQGRRLIEYIRDVRGGRVTVQQLRQAFRHLYNSADEARAALDALVTGGLGYWEAQAPSPKGGRPTSVFVLHPPRDPGEDDGDACADPPRPTPGNPETPETGAKYSPEQSNGRAGGQSAHPETSGHPGTAPTQPPADSCLVDSGEGFRVSGCPSGAKQNEGREDRIGFRVSATPGKPRKPPSSQGHGTGPADRVGPLGSYCVVREASDLSMMLAALDESVRVGIDCETTGLDPRADRIRLLSLATDRGVYVVDCFTVDPRPIFEPLAALALIGHNLLFDLQFLATLGFEPGASTHDTMLLSQLLDGTRRPKGYHGLAECVERHLEHTLDKTEQSGDWSGPLTDAQLDYAAADVSVLGPLYDRLTELIAQSGQDEAARIEARCLPAVVWMARSGAPFDANAWEELAGVTEQEAKELAAQLDLLAPRPPGALPGMAGWNWSSPEQVQEAFRLARVELEATDDEALASVDHPLAALLRTYRSKSKLASTYGREWAGKALRDQRLYAGWRQMGCVTGRMAVRAPNLQNLPGDPRYRACFRAPDGRVLVKADYGQIELRIAAKVTGDEAMLRAYARGEDLHTLTAARMLGKPPGEVTAAERKLAKPVNFGLIYGLGVDSLRRKARADYGLDLGEEEARRYKAAFFAAYPGVAHWHRRVRRERATQTRTLAGRRARVEADGFYGAKANYVVQGTGGDGIKLALALLWERRHDCPGAFPVLAVHDEVVVECAADQAGAVAAWLKRAMVDALAPLLDPVPVEVEVTMGRTWGGD